jgi:D-beta-D-heptose 7-phosphate kinase/D-beta-D-heptose 1-phosphate adenosyltransferase
MLRVDREVRTPLSPYLEDELILRIALQLPACDAVLISDYAKGVCTPRLLHLVIDECRRRKLPVIVDPASSADYRTYCYATAVTPNRAETSRATSRPVQTADDAFAAGKRLCLQLQLDYCFVTLDSDGIALVRADGSCDMLRTRKREVYDITGAGDMVLATIGVGAAAGIDPVDLAALANIAGGLEVEQVGVVRVTRQQMLADLLATRRTSSEKVCTLEEAARHVQARKGLNQRIVLTNGCFDLLHPGHVRFLNEASSHGDCLVVAINSDEGVRSHKGPDRPVIPESDRASMLAALECIDYVVIFRDATPHAVLSELKPHLLVKGGTTPEVVGRELVESYGGQVLTLNAHGTYSTTDVVNRIRRAA